MVGAAPISFPPVAFVNRLPRRAREWIYTWSGWLDAIPAKQLHQVRAEALSEWIGHLYPKRQFPAVMIGATNGAAIHLCAALGIPWLPQTFLIPVRQNCVLPDEPTKALHWGRQAAPALRASNPELQLHHMHDPNQDRLMLQQLTYFRVKRLRLGSAYESFLRERLEPGGTIFLLDCRLTWPTTRVADRHIFQQGAPGGATHEEFFRGSQRVAAYLERYQSPCRKWAPPEPDGMRSEAEWSFEPVLGEEVEWFAREHGYQLHRIVFREPEHLSPLVADLYRWWYRQRRMAGHRLLAESFIVLEPWWTFRIGAVPFWLKFPMEPSADLLDRYLDRVEPFDYIH